MQLKTNTVYGLRFVQVIQDDSDEQDIRIVYEHTQEEQLNNSHFSMAQVLIESIQYIHSYRFYTYHECISNDSPETTFYAWIPYELEAFRKLIGTLKH